MFKLIASIVIFGPYIVSVVAFVFSKLIWVANLIGIEVLVSFDNKIKQYILSKWSLILPIDFINIISYENLSSLFYTVLTSMAIGIVLLICILAINRIFKINYVVILDALLTFSLLYMMITIYFVGISGKAISLNLRHVNLSLLFLMQIVRTVLHKIDPDPTIDLNYEE